MGAGGDKKTAASTTSTACTARLKREECKRTKHDSAFSDWKILVGSSDWDDYLRGKEGAERYRTQNLPNCTSCPGIYELGVAFLRSQSGQRTRKLDPHLVIPVYLGQADNVRNRLQQYGREGSHLEKVYSNTQLNDQNYEYGEKLPGLFTDVFSRGFSMVYRWAPMENKREAEKTEALLLNKFDYAWNKDINGWRRHTDILKKIDRNSKASQLNFILRKLQVFPQKKLGIKIKVCESHTSGSGSCTSDQLESNSLLTRILKFGKSRPRLVSSSFGVDHENAEVCGVALGHGLVCTRPPVEGRKRCAEHKGMKVNGFTSKMPTNRDSSMHSGMINHGVACALQSDDYQSQYIVSRYSNEDPAITCGFIMDSGFPCTNMPVQGNKRCLKHKGSRIRRVSQTATEANKDTARHPVQDYMADCENNQHVFSDKSCRAQFEALSKLVDLGNNHKIICGVYLEDGTACSRSPVSGRKRCEEHKGMRVKTAKSKLLRAAIISTENPQSR